MTEFTFAPATRESAKARVALEGPSGSGKTFSALLLAKSLGERIAVIDTERGSAAKYAGDPVTFDTLQMHTFDPRDLPKALSAAGQAGYDVVIVDSLSHFWMGTDGMLEQVDNAAKRGYGGNSFGGWKEAAPMERGMIDALLAYPGHVIVTMRTKTEWVIEEDSKGRKVPRKIGLKPVQRDGVEYEFDVVGDMDIENTLTISKSRCRALSGAVIRRPDGDSLGTPLNEWLSDGAPAPTAGDYLKIALDPTSTFEDLGTAYHDAEQRNLLAAPVNDETGTSRTLGDLLIQRGNAAKAEAAAAMREASNGDATQTDGGEAVSQVAGASADEEPQGSGGETTPPSDTGEGAGSGADQNGEAAPEPPTEADDASAPEDDERPMITDKTRRRMFALFNEHNIKDRDQRLSGISEVIGRDVGSASDLFEDEAEKVVGILAAKAKPEPAGVAS